MKRLVDHMDGKIREINVKVGQIVTEDGQIFLIKDMKLENITGVHPGAGNEVFISMSGHLEEESPWMICDGEGFGR
jgi:acetyl/propionyl-CoA carboxylase alpha subunit